MTLSLPAQKKEINEAKTCLKTNKNLDKAEKLMRSVIAMPGQEHVVENHVLLVDILKKQYENSNEKMYLRQLKDTASVFPLLQRVFYACETLDGMKRFVRIKRIKNSHISIAEILIYSFIFQ